MKAKQLLYTAIILFPFFSPVKSKAQNRERHRSVTINQTVVDGKVVASDTIITYTDTTTRTINSKEVSMDMPYNKGSTVYINSEYRKLNIRQSKDGKVKLTTTTFFYGEPTFTNEQWLEKLNITMKNTDTGMVITSGGINSSGFTSSSWSNTTTDWNKVIAERNEAVLEREKATIERSKAAIERNRELVERNKALRERSKATTERNGVIPIPPAPPIGATITRNGASSEVRANGNGSISGTTTATNNALKEVDIDGWVNGISNEIRPARSYSTSTGSRTAVFDERGNNVYTSSSLRRELTIYIPADAKLNVVSKYADVNADHDLKNLKIKISNGSLDMANTDNATINSSYSNISCGNIGNGDVTITNGRLSMKNADQLLLNTKYSKVEMDNCTRLDMKSTSDDYDLDAVKMLSGTKNYGNLRIDKLTGSFDLKGSSADVKIRNIDPTVSSITLDNKYSDIRFPVSGLKNYEVVFSGTYSSVFAPFERRDTTMEKKPEPSTATRYEGIGTGVVTVYSGSSAARKNNTGFYATVGDTKGLHTKFNLSCSNCNVDFK